MSRFLKADVVRLNLTGGDYIIVKRELTAGERRRVFARTTKTVKAGQPIEIDLEKTGITNLVEYLVDWSFVDEQGKPVAIKDMPHEYVTDVLNSLDGDSFAEIMQAVDAHELAVAEEKNTDWRDRTLSDLRVCRIMHWTLPDLLALPGDVYDLLVDDIIREHDEQS